VHQRRWWRAVTDSSSREYYILDFSSTWRWIKQACRQTGEHLWIISDEIEGNITVTLSRGSCHAATFSTVSLYQQHQSFMWNVRVSRTMRYAIERCEVWGSHGGDNEERCLLGWNALYRGKSLSTFRRDVGNFYQTRLLHIKNNLNNVRSVNFSVLIHSYLKLLIARN
jgi:hypothetical protein